MYQKREKFCINNDEILQTLAAWVIDLVSRLTLHGFQRASPGPKNSSASGVDTVDESGGIPANPLYDIIIRDGWATSRHWRGNANVRPRARNNPRGSEQKLVKVVG